MRTVQGGRVFQVWRGFFETVDLQFGRSIRSVQAPVPAQTIQGCQASVRSNHPARSGPKPGRFNVARPLHGPLALLI